MQVVGRWTELSPASQILCALSVACIGTHYTTLANSAKSNNTQD